MAKQQQSLQSFFGPKKKKISCIPAKTAKTLLKNKKLTAKEKKAIKENTCSIKKKPVKDVCIPGKVAKTLLKKKTLTAKEKKVINNNTCKADLKKIVRRAIHDVFPVSKSEITYSELFDKAKASSKLPHETFSKILDDIFDNDNYIEIDQLTSRNMIVRRIKPRKTRKTSEPKPVEIWADKYKIGDKFKEKYLQGKMTEDEYNNPDVWEVMTQRTRDQMEYWQKKAMLHEDRGRRWDIVLRNPDGGQQEQFATTFNLLKKKMTAFIKPHDYDNETYQAYKKRTRPEVKKHYGDVFQVPIMSEEDNLFASMVRFFDKIPPLKSKEIYYFTKTNDRGVVSSVARFTAKDKGEFMQLFDNQVTLENMHDYSIVKATSIPEAIKKVNKVWKKLLSKPYKPKPPKVKYRKAYRKAR